MKAASLVEHYENLRGDVVSGAGGGLRRWGMNLLLRRGLAAWMDAWSIESIESIANGAHVPGTSVVPVAAASSSDIRLPRSLQQHVTGILVEMILQRSSVPA